MTGSCVPEMLLAANNNSNIDTTSNNFLDINNTLATFFTGKCNEMSKNAKENLSLFEPF